jgi:hypothetical protein
MRFLITLTLLTACTSGNEIAGPFDGPIQRFAVDRITLPSDNASAMAMGDDLTGSGTIDNDLGMVLGELALQNDLDTHAADVIASGTIASFVELQTAGEGSTDADVTYYGFTGAPAVAAGGKLVAGAFASNLTRDTDVPGAALLALPVFPESAPSLVPLHAMEIELTPDGSGGFNAAIRGGVPAGELSPVAARGLLQMIADDPVDHDALARALDTANDHTLTGIGVETNGLVESLIAPDVTLFGEQDLSFGFVVHLVPCPTGNCALATPADTCADGVKDGDETGVDCGGSCALACGGGAVCRVDGDCQSQQCNAGTCLAPGCSDGILDGLESDVDCGWSCAGCAPGKQCFEDSDCASGACSVESTYPGMPGTCN